MQSEPALVRLNAQVDRRLKEVEKNRLVDSTIQACRDLGPRDALELVRRSRQQLSTDERLLSLEARLKERIQQLSVEERRAEYLSGAHDALKASRFADAVRILEACQGQNLGSDEVTALLEYAHAEEAEQNREQLKRTTLENAQSLINDGAFDQAIQFLDAALAQSNDTTVRMLLDQASTAREAVLRQVDVAMQSARKLATANRIEDASQLLKALPRTALLHPRPQAAIVMLEDEKDHALYRHLGRAYALLDSDRSKSKVIAMRVAAASPPQSGPSQIARSIDAKISH